MKALVRQRGAAIMTIPSAETDSWSIAEGAHEGKPIMIRFRSGLRAYLGDPAYPRRLTIIWDYDCHNTSGMPANEHSNAMKSFEDAIIGALDPDRSGVLAFVITHAGEREWHWYIRDVEEAGAKINQALADLPGLPIQLEVADDATWDELRQVFDGCS